MEKDKIIDGIFKDSKLTDTEKRTAIQQEKGQTYANGFVLSLPMDIQLDEDRTIRIIQFALTGTFTLNFDIEFYRNNTLEPYWDQKPTNIVDVFGTTYTFRNHWTITNPPLLVPDNKGTVLRRNEDEFGEEYFDTYREDVLESFKLMCLTHDMFD